MMNASKENARKALALVSKELRQPSYEFVAEFLTAVIRKLPSEAAYKRDKSRRRQKKKAHAIN